MWIYRSSIKGIFPRYICQRDKCNCGPVTIINYWKWCGFKVGIKDLRFFSRILESGIRPRGTYEDDMERIFNQKWQKVTWKRFYNHLLNVGPIIVLEDHRHYWFAPNFIEFKNGVMNVLGINYVSGQTYHIIPFNEMKRVLRKSLVILCS
jgi:hypothetical protein